MPRPLCPPPARPASGRLIAHRIPLLILSASHHSLSPQMPDTHDHETLSPQTANTDSIHSADTDSIRDRTRTVHAYGRPISDHLSQVSHVHPPLSTDTSERPRVSTPAFPDLHVPTPLLPSGHPPPLPITPDPPPTASHAPPVLQEPSTSVN